VKFNKVQREGVITGNCLALFLQEFAQFRHQSPAVGCVYKGKHGEGYSGGGVEGVADEVRGIESAETDADANGEIQQFWPEKPLLQTVEAGVATEWCPNVL
jgi:hypothetical protein